MIIERHLVYTKRGWDKILASQLFWIVKQDAVVGSTTLISSAFYSPTQLWRWDDEIEF